MYMRSSVADEDLRGWNVLPLTPLCYCYKNCSIYLRSKFCCPSISLYHNICIKAAQTRLFIALPLPHLCYGSLPQSPDTHFWIMSSSFCSWERSVLSSVCRCFLMWGLLLGMSRMVASRSAVKFVCSNTSSAPWTPLFWMLGAYSWLGGRQAGDKDKWMTIKTVGWQLKRSRWQRDKWMTILHQHVTIWGQWCSTACPSPLQVTMSIMSANNNGWFLPAWQNTFLDTICANTITHVTRHTHTRTHARTHAHTHRTLTRKSMSLSHCCTWAFVQ